MPKYANTAWKRAKLETAMMDYLSDHAHRQVSSEELATVFQVSQNTVRRLMLHYIKEGLILIVHQPIEVSYQFKDVQTDT